MERLTIAARVRINGPTMSRSSIQRTLTRGEMRPHKIRMGLHSKDPLFRHKVGDIVDLYLNPPPDAVMLSVDEKTGIQALERPYRRKLARPGRPGR